MEYLFNIIVFIWIASEILLTVLLKSKMGNSSINYDKGTLKKIWTTIFISLVLGIYVSSSSIGKIAFGEYFSFLGLILIILGLVIRWVAIITLREYFTVDVIVVKNQKIINKGIYKIIRHPSYLGSIISFLGLGITLSNIFALIIINVPIILVFIHRIKIEEEALIQNIGQEYIEYSKATKKLLPKIY